MLSGETVRIAICNSRRRWGGASSMAALLARGLRRRGHDVVVFCGPGSDLWRELQPELPCEPILRGPDFPFPGIAACARALQRHGTQAALCAVPKDLRLVGPAARLRRVPLVMRRVSGAPFGGSPLARLLDRAPDHYVANSQATRRAMVGSAPWLRADAVSVVHNGVDVEAIAAAAPAELGLPPHARVVGFMGRLDPEKGALDLGAAWRSIVRRVPTAHLVIAGSGSEERELQARLRDSPQVRLLGFRRDIASLLRAFDVLAVPSHSEAFGLSAAEAMAAGVPVVATRVGGLPEVVEDGVQGLLVPPGAPQALADAVVALLEDEARRRRMGAEGERRARACFGQERAIDGYEAVLRRVVARGAGGVRTGIA